MNNEQSLSACNAWSLSSPEKGKPFEPDMFIGASCGGVRMTDILYWYDGPIMFLAENNSGEHYFVVISDDNRKTRNYEHMALSLSVAEYASMRDATDIETVNDMARAALLQGAEARLIVSTWEGMFISEITLSRHQAEKHIGDGHGNPQSAQNI